MVTGCCTAARSCRDTPFRRTRIRADHCPADRRSSRPHHSDVLPALRRQTRCALPPRSRVSSRSQRLHGVDPTRKVGADHGAGRTHRSGSRHPGLAATDRASTKDRPQRACTAGARASPAPSSRPRDRGVPESARHRPWAITHSGSCRRDVLQPGDGAMAGRTGRSPVRGMRGVRMERHTRLRRRVMGHPPLRGRATCALQVRSGSPVHAHRLRELQNV